MVSVFEIDKGILWVIALALIVLLFLLSNRPRKEGLTAALGKDVCCCRYSNSYGLGCSAVEDVSDCKLYCQSQGGTFCGYGDDKKCSEGGYNSCQDYCAQIS